MAMTSRSSSDLHLAPGAKVPVLGRQDVGTLMRTGQKGLKQDGERIKRFPQPTLRSQASSSPLFKIEGSAIYDLLFELSLERKVSPFKDSTPDVLLFPLEAKKKCKIAKDNVVTTNAEFSIYKRIYSFLQGQVERSLSSTVPPFNRHFIIESDADKSR